MFGFEHYQSFLPEGHGWVEEGLIGEQEVMELIAILRSFQLFVQLFFEPLKLPSGLFQSIAGWFGNGYACDTMSENLYHYLQNIEKLGLLSQFSLGSKTYGRIDVHVGMPIHLIRNPEFFLVVDTWRASDGSIGEVWTKGLFDLQIEQMDQMSSPARY